MRKNWVKGLMKFDFGMGVDAILLASAAAIVSHAAIEYNKYCDASKEHIDREIDILALKKEVRDLKERVLYLENEELEED